MVQVRHWLLSSYAIALYATLAGLVLRFLLHPFLQDNAPLLVFILPVVVSAWYGGLRPGLMATALSLLVGTYFFMPGAMAFDALAVVNGVRIAIFLTEGVIISVLSEALRNARSRAEKIAISLKESEEQNRLLVKNVKDYAIFGLDSTGHITSWNSGAKLITGYQFTEVLGRHFSTFYTVESLEQNQPAQALQVATAEGRFEGIGWRKRRDGSLFWANVVITALRDEHGKLQGFSNITRDITERKRTEQELQQSHNLLQSVVEGTADAIFVKDLQGRYQLVNSMAAQAIGKLKQEILGKDDSQLFPARVAIAIQTVDRAVMQTGQSQIIEEQVSEIDGTRVFLSTKDPYRDANGNIIGLIGISRDITERKRAELLQQQLLKDLSNLKFALDQAAILATTDATGVITEVNDKFCKTSKFSREELIGQSYQIVGSGHHPEEFFQTLWTTITQGNVWHGEIKNRAKDGAYYWVDTTIVPLLDQSGEPSQYLSVRFDITERKQIEKKLGRSLQRLEDVHQIDLAILRTEPLEAIAQCALSRLCQIIRCNQAAVVLFDFEAETIRFLADEQLRSGETSVEPSEELTPVSNTEVPMADWLPKDTLLYRNSVWYVKDIADWVSRPLNLERQLAAGYHSFLAIAIRVDNKLLGDVVLFARQPDAFSLEDQEVVEEVANQLAIAIQQARLREQIQQHLNDLEQRVAEHTAELQEANEGLQTFSYSISHDLRAPLRAMQGLAQAVLEDYSSEIDATGQLYLQEIAKAARQADKLTIDVLNYARLAQANISMHSINLNSVVAEVLEQLAAQIQTQQAQIRVATFPEVLGHRSTLIQVMLNLVGNAIKFVSADRHPQVYLWAETVEKSSGERIGSEGVSGEGIEPGANSLSDSSFSCDAPCRWVRLWVEDNGIGIEPKYHAQIFQTFERLHNTDEYPGTGVGLAIVRKGVERMGGHVGVESILGQGSRFWLELVGINGHHK